MKNGNETKQKLIDATRQMIDTNGLDSVSMRDLGKETKLSRGAVYRHFKNKDDLLAAVAAQDFEMIKNRIYKLIEEINDPVKLVHEIFHTFYHFGMKNQEQYQLMFRKEWNREQYPDLYASAFALYGVIETCLGKAQEPKYTANQSPKQLTAMASALVVGLVELHSAGHLESEKGLDDPAALIDSFLDMIFNGGAARGTL